MLLIYRDIAVAFCLFICNCQCASRHLYHTTDRAAILMTSFGLIWLGVSILNSRSMTPTGLRIYALFLRPIHPTFSLFCRTTQVLKDVRHLTYMYVKLSMRSSCS